MSVVLFLVSLTFYPEIQIEYLGEMILFKEPWSRHDTSARIAGAATTLFCVIVFSGCGGNAGAPVRPDFSPSDKSVDANAVLPRSQANRIAYSALDTTTPGGGDYDIWTSAPDGTDAVRLTSKTNSEMDPSWSPNRDYIAYTSSLDRGIDSGHSTIFPEDTIQYRSLRFMKSDGTSDKVIWDAKENGSHAVRYPRFAPTGDAIIADVVGEDGKEALYKFHTGLIGVSSQTTKLCDLGGAGAWSPIGDRFVFSAIDRDKKSTQWKLYMLRLSDGDVHAISSPPVPADPVGSTNTPREYYDTTPTWSPDGTSIIFARSKSSDVSILGDPVPGIYSIAAPAPSDSGIPTPQLVRAGRYFGPHFSPDGTTIMADEQGADGILHMVKFSTSGTGSQTRILPDVIAGSTDWTTAAPLVAGAFK